MNVIHLASQGDSVESMYYFKLKGMSLNDQDSEGNTPLHWAVIE